MDRGFFLIQHVDFVQGGRPIKGNGVIGSEHPFGATDPSENIKAHWLGNPGETFDYTYAVTGDTLTIWGEWSDDGKTSIGGWTYPGGGGRHESTMTRAMK